MNSFLLNRALGSIDPWSFYTAQTSRLVQCLEPSPGIQFRNSKDAQAGNSSTFERLDENLAHKAGVNVLAVDTHGGR